MIGLAGGSLGERPRTDWPNNRANCASRQYIGPAHSLATGDRPQPQQAHCSCLESGRWTLLCSLIFPLHLSLPLLADESCKCVAQYFVVVWTVLFMSGRSMKRKVLLM